MGICQQLKKVSPPVFILVMLFSMSTWIDVVGIWVEMPLFVRDLPEQWRLPSYITIIIQCANVGPALYAIVHKIRGAKKVVNGYSNHVSRSATMHDLDVIVAFVIIAISIMSIFLMAFFWNRTTIVAGEAHSVALMALMMLTALCSCTSSVVFLPYMARFSSLYISAYYIGQGLCGLIPGLAGLIQGTGQRPACVNVTKTIWNETAMFNDTRFSLKAIYKPPLFSVSSFLWFLCAMVCVSFVAFFCLNRFFKKEMVGAYSSHAKMSSDVIKLDTVEKSPNSPEVELNNQSLTNNSAVDSELNEVDITSNLTDDAHTKPSANGEITSKIVVKRKIKAYRFALLLVMVGTVNAMTNGMLPATQSYTCLPYGDLAYTLAIRLSSVASPLASLTSMFLPRASLLVVSILTVIGTSISALHLTLAALSPHPPLQGLVSGEALIVCTAAKILFSLIVSCL